MSINTRLERLEQTSPQTYYMAGAFGEGFNKVIDGRMTPITKEEYIAATAKPMKHYKVENKEMSHGKE